MQLFGLPVVVALNKFGTDTDKEIAIVEAFVKANGVRFAVSNVWESGGKGGEILAEEVLFMN